MNIKESDLIKANGWSKGELRKIRNEDKEFEGHKLWFADNENKPKIFQTIFWTPVGVIYLEEYFKAKAMLEQMANAKEDVKLDIITEEDAMTKGHFTKNVNNTRWIGKIIRNSYKNHKLVLVQHETGFNVLATCKDNILYPKNRWVVVDTLENKHTIRKPAFKSYEQAQKQKI